MDFAEILEKLKKEGLEMTEETAKKAITVLLDAAADFVKNSPNPYDDFALGAIEPVKKLLLGLAENINPND